MKYNQKYAWMRPALDEDHNIIRGTKAIPCCICGELTEFAEINYEAPICSDECMDILDRGDS